MAELTYELLGGIEKFPLSHDEKPIGIKILVSVGRPLTEEDLSNGYAMVRDLEESLKRVATRIELQDPESTKSKAKQNEQKELLGCFDQPIFYDTIQNGYCPQACCAHLPWFLVTTKIGQFKIGWRKRVIAIEWPNTRCHKTADELFPNENVTKDGKMIHAWSYDKAKEYIRRITDEAQKAATSAG